MLNTGTDPDTPPPIVGGSSAGLVAAYGFDEDNGTTVTDASGEGNHGTIEGATRITSGRYGKALKFDGLNDLVIVNHSDSLNLSTGMTLEAWVYPQSTNTWQTVILKGNSGGAAYNLYSHDDLGLPLTAFNDGSYQIISGFNPLSLNEWNHLVATYDGQDQRLYVNGIEVAQSDQNGLIKPFNGDLFIGGNNIWGGYFKGYIDEVRIYNRALTATEVNNNLAAAVSVPGSVE
ncbi:MAG: hypothetical protein GQ529_12315 [Methyloprofundus sp.]|nr:hypothetical protein [Methyloprofundus sp.]